ncbi:hypothetical protein [Oceanobacillus polygoni]|uniref:Uncharacterized protein n=1 Tax=Oceanobacillus polygoni TaxID=1235259 RepID=A0A9X0YR21_9BACI|nr:hypothetical protein [Oceanobacillus polygoni]MBP2077119.1 hypothetical protein [Oceanobacillus polygoni]
MKRPFGRFIAIMIFYIALMFILSFINEGIGIEVYLSFFVFFALLYADIEALLSLINNGNYLVIIGFLILIISVITFAGGLWEENNKFIYKPFIIAIAAAAVYITFRDLLDIADFSERAKK